MHYLEFKNVNKIFIPPVSIHNLLRLNFTQRKPIKALDNISFSVEKGQIIGILGPNGSGKTTLLKIISSLILPNKGEVIIKGYKIGRDDQKIKSLIGLVSSQERSFYWRLTGKQNLEFFASMYGLNKKDSEKRIADLFSLFHIDYRLQNTRFDSLSTGLKQKFVIIRALINNPELLLLDEPTKSLDYKTTMEFKNLIKEKIVKEEKKTVLFTTHQLNEALDFSDRFIILNKGEMVSSGSIDELRRKINNPEATLTQIFQAVT